MKQVIALFLAGLFAHFLCFTVNAQIQSVVSGGEWNETSTWIGGVIPDADDDVIINGPVYTETNSCNNLTISPGASLQNNYYGSALTVYGNVTNYGSISNYVSTFSIKIKGDIFNAGIWNNHNIEISGSTDQSLTCLNGNTFGVYQFSNIKTAGDVIISNEVHFKDCNVNLGNPNVLIPEGSTLKLDNSLVYQSILLGSGAGSVVHGEGSCDDGPAVLENVAASNLTLNGSINVKANCTMSGTIVNNAFLQNDYFGYLLKIYDDFINNGTIQNYTSNLNIDIYGNLTNNHVVNNYSLIFRGGGDQEITLLNGKVLSPTILNSNKPTGKIVALTDIYFDMTQVNLNTGTLLLQNDGTISFHGGYFSNAVLTDANTDEGYLHLHMTNEAYMNNSLVYNPEILGTVEISTGNSFIGEVLISDTLQNDYFGYTLDVSGNIINNGIIKDNNSTLSLNITGNIANNGIWSNFRTYLTGTGAQHVTCLNQLPFSGFQFISSNSTGLVYFDDHVKFENVQIMFQYNNLELPVNSVLSIHQGYLSSCNLHGNGETSVLHAEGVYYTDAPFMQFCTLEDIKLTGDWGLASEITMNGLITNDGILQNAYFAYAVDVNGDFINNGTIQSFSSGLTMKMHGHVTNNGSWAGHAFDLYGTSTQELFLEEGKKFNPTYFTSNKPSGQIKALTNITFENTIVNLNFDPLIMPDHATLSIKSQLLRRGVVSAETDRFNLFLSDEAYIQECTLHDVNLYGKTEVSLSNEFYGLTINHGILQNDYFQYSVDFFGDLINNGTIQNYSSAFILNAHADITNNGVWTNHYTNMVGTADQYIHLKNGHWIDGMMKLISDVQNGGYQWYLNSLAIVSASPNPEPFNGYTGFTLQFNTPVSGAWLGTFKCSSNGTWSRNIIVDEQSSMRLDVTAFLEGPYNGTNMSADLNSMIPLQQGLTAIGYDGPEAVAEIPNEHIVDWIGLELRDASDINSATEATSIGGGAFFIRNDGKIVGLDGSSMPSFDFIINNQLFVALWTRNHLPVISAYPLVQSGGIYTYDFTPSAGQAYGDNQSDLGEGVYGMIGGDANADGTINEFDGTDTWLIEVGHTGYLQSDVNMDTQADNKDKNDVWFKNQGKTGILPE